MDLTLGQHIRRLQLRLEALSEEIMRPDISLEKRNKIESDIRAVDLALKHYRAALEIEQTISR